MVGPDVLAADVESGRVLLARRRNARCRSIPKSLRHRNLQHLGGLVGRTIIDDDDFGGSGGLDERGLYRVGEVPRLPKTRDLPGMTGPGQAAFAAVAHRSSVPSGRVGSRPPLPVAMEPVATARVITLSIERLVPNSVEARKPR